MGYKKTTNLGKEFGDKLLRETFSNYFNEEQKTAVDKIITAFNDGMDTEDYLLLYEDTLKPFSKKIKHHLNMYLTLYLMPDEKDFSHLIWTEEEINKTYKEIR